MRYSYVLICTLIVTIGSCKEDSVSPKDEVKPPRTSDSTWYYLDRTSMHIDTFKVDFYGSMNLRLDGIEYTVMKQSAQYLSVPTDRRILYWDGPDGCYTMGVFDSYDTLYTKILMYKYPAHAGDMYDYRWLSISSADTYYVSNQVLTMTVIAVDTLIQTPAGIFKCNQYQYSKRPADDIYAVWQYNFYYAPHIGLISQRIISTVSNTINEDSYLIKRE